MNINQAALQLFHSYGHQKVSLSEGQLFVGKVTKLFSGGFAQLEAVNMKLTAKLEIPLSAGKSYLFQVEKLDEMPHLKLVEARGAFSSYNDATIISKVILRQLSLSSSGQNIQFVRRLLDEGLPISKSLLTSSIQWFNNGEITTHEMAAVKTLVQHQLPLTEQTFKAILILFSKESLTSLLTDLSRVIEEAEPSSVNVEKVQQVIRQLLELTRNVKEELAVNDSKGPQSSPFLLLKQLIHLLGVNYENAVHRFSLQTMSSKNFEEELHTLKPLLLNILNEESSSPLKMMAEQVVNRLTGIQLANYEDFLQTILFQIPFGDKTLNQDAVIQWQDKKKNGKIDADFCRILFHLTLKNLKETVVDVQVQNRIVSIQIYTEHKMAVETVNVLSGLLKKQLANFNYHLSHVKFVEPVKKKSFHSPSLHEKLFHSYKGVDIQV
ncbi:hypothetical protein [Bacillus taeanensis]|uniref:Flagellar hook-length control protein-like C-terminal domain-containing protein n=1 Tax=Bacillus taeanensis TaxID=273032 RepID=A0A366XTR1_9BACI|nr:hypothetical protein [Bacillus taeanensis]RBW67534.1 hypothetical protein DS031_21885 [Bacillus taeanensis]